MKCSRCGHEMILQYSKKFLYQSGNPRAVWRCSNSLWCTNERWAHPNGSPMSTEADRETKQARYLAHVALGMLPKRHRYSWLQRAMQRRREDAHIGYFNKDECHLVVQLVCQEVGIL